MTQSLERSTTVIPAYDKRHPDPRQNYGIGAARLAFIVKGPAGAVQLMLSTGWYTPSAVEHLKGFPRSEYDLNLPMGFDVDYHSPTPQYEGQTPVKDCHILQGDCYCDGSALRADEWAKKLVLLGTEWLWPALEEYYHEMFGGEAP